MNPNDGPSRCKTEDPAGSAFSYHWDRRFDAVRGGYGTIHKMWRTHRKTNVDQKVAVKAVRKGWGDTDRPQPDPRELKVLKIIKHHKHENIIGYFESFESTNLFLFDGIPHVCFVFECMDEDLDEVISKLKETGETWPEARVASVLAGVLSGEQFLHSHRIVHRDVNPNNVLLKYGKYVPKLTDFGLAQEMPRGVDYIEMDSLAGVIEYLAPEEWGDCLGYKSDVYSTGVLAFELCSLQYPFAKPCGDHIKDPLEREAYEEDRVERLVCDPDVPPDWSSPRWKVYSEGLKKLIASLLTKKYIDRPSVGKALNDPYLSKHSNKKSTANKPKTQTQTQPHSSRDHSPSTKKRSTTSSPPPPPSSSSTKSHCLPRTGTPNTHTKHPLMHTTQERKTSVGSLSSGISNVNVSVSVSTVSAPSSRTNGTTPPNGSGSNRHHKHK